MTARKLSVSGGRDGCGSDGRKSEALAAVVEHCGGAGGADAGDANGAQLEQGIEGANAAGGFYLHAGRGVAAHEHEVEKSGPAGGITGGGFDPIHADGAADFAQADLRGVVVVGVLEDHLDLRAGVVGDVGEGGFRVRRNPTGRCGPG